AARWLGRAAELTPDYPNVQFALGTAWFNGGGLGPASPPPPRAGWTPGGGAAAGGGVGGGGFVEQSCDGGGAGTGGGRGGAGRRDDPGRGDDAALQYAYGVALVRSDHAAEAEAVFSKLLQTHHDNAPLNVVLGMAYAEQGDRDAAIQALQRALKIDPQVRGA